MLTMSAHVMTIMCIMVSWSASLRAMDYRSPCELAVSPDGSTIAIGDYTARQLVLMASDGAIMNTIALQGQAAGVAWALDGSRVYVAERGAWSVAEIDPQVGAVTRRFAVGRYPIGVAVSTGHVVVANNGTNTLSIIDRLNGIELGRVPCVSRPWSVALTPDGAMAVVGNMMPFGDARLSTMAASISLIDVTGQATVANLNLPPGSINVHGVAISPDGQWAYVVHSVGRFTLPTTQIERGWVMTHAMSIINLSARNHEATVILDLISQGAADPWGIALAPDGATAWITLAGIHQVARLDLTRLHALLAGDIPKDLRLPGNSIWHQIKRDQSLKQGLINDLAALNSTGVMTRIDIPAQGPRGIAMIPGPEPRLAVASYFAGQVVLLDADTIAVQAQVSLGPQPDASSARAGEQLFFDAGACFQNWMSCASCHPEGRADGLNWDLLNDGMGNPKNTKSMTLAHRTPPVMASGVRASMEVATEKGFMAIQFREMSQEDLDHVRAHIRSIPVEGSPYLVNEPGKKLACAVCHHGPAVQRLSKEHMVIDGSLSPEAQRGLALFKDTTVGCITCHPGPLFTDLKMHNVGTRHDVDQRNDFDNPTCYELWRTAPFLHDGSAATLRGMLTTINPQDRHGRTSHLSEADRQALVAFLLSL